MKRLIYKKYQKIICYINCTERKFTVCTGKPSDLSCISWTYTNIRDAKFTALEYFENYCNIIKK